VDFCLFYISMLRRVSTKFKVYFKKDSAINLLHHPGTLVYGAMLGGEPLPDARWGWAWPLSGVEAFVEPVPAQGAQGFWKWEAQ
jgi:hypothetical protein